jgi:hypothetical protein
MVNSLDRRKALACCANTETLEESDLLFKIRKGGEF